ncbi:MAG TPA: 4-hydroxybenzoate octaprenyltransferase [Phycisphaerales bacterium]|jgi:4-hydroxybenzoate polyprenyltransferase|nr:4-hydroxybenzoate octaprenyltransferase [Phycisphaerales bacterium]
MKPVLLKLLTDIKISHTVFAMPFALLGAFMAGINDGAIVWTAFGWQLVLIVICMFFARNVAMLANRILDRKIDANNPRTQNRVIASGEVEPAVAGAYFFCNVILFIGFTGFFMFWENLLPLYLSVPVLIILVAYPLFKRFTWLCHVYLGTSLALSPVAAAIAIAPETLTHLPIWLLSGAVLCWVAGFDIIYALQDIACDKRDNLKSMPASLGVKPAMLISQFLHCICVALLFGIATTDQHFGWLFLGATVLIAAVLIYEHLTVKKWGTTKIALTFFTLNGVVSLVLGTAGIIDLLL